MEISSSPRELATYIRDKKIDEIDLSKWRLGKDICLGELSRLVWILFTRLESLGPIELQEYIVYYCRPALQSLRVERRRLRGLMGFAEILPTTGIRSLEIIRCRWELDGWDLLFQTIEKCQLRHLDISHCPVSRSEVDLLRKVVVSKNSGLVSLKMDGITGGEELEEIVELNRINIRSRLSLQDQCWLIIEENKLDYQPVIPTLLIRLFHDQWFHDDGKWLSRKS